MSQQPIPFQTHPGGFPQTGPWLSGPGLPRGGTNFVYDPLYQQALAQVNNPNAGDTYKHLPGEFMGTTPKNALVGGIVGMGVSEGIRLSMGHMDDQSLLVRAIRRLDNLPGVRHLNNFLEGKILNRPVIQNNHVLQVLAGKQEPLAVFRESLKTQVAAMEADISARGNSALLSSQSLDRLRQLALEEIPTEKLRTDLLSYHVDTLAKQIRPKNAQLADQLAARLRGVSTVEELADRLSPFQRNLGVEGFLQRVKQHFGFTASPDSQIQQLLGRFDERARATLTKTAESAAEQIPLHITAAEHYLDDLVKLVEPSALTMSERATHWLRAVPGLSWITRKLGGTGTLAHEGFTELERTRNTVKYLSAGKRFNGLNRFLAQELTEATQIAGTGARPIGQALLHVFKSIKAAFGAEAMMGGTGKGLSNMTKGLKGRLFGGFAGGGIILGMALTEAQKADKGDKWAAFNHNFWGIGVGSMMGWFLGKELLATTPWIPNLLNGFRDGKLFTKEALANVPGLGKFGLFKSAGSLLNKPLKLLQKLPLFSRIEAAANPFGWVMKTPLKFIPKLGPWLAGVTLSGFVIEVLAMLVIGTFFQKAFEGVSHRIFGKPKSILEEQRKARGEIITQPPANPNQPLDRSQFMQFQQLRQNAMAMGMTPEAATVAATQAMQGQAPRGAAVAGPSGTTAPAGASGGASPFSLSPQQIAGNPAAEQQAQLAQELRKSDMYLNSLEPLLNPAH